MIRDCINMKRYSGLLTSLLLLVASSSSYAEVGRVVFAYGDVTAENSNGQVRRLTKRDEVEAGEVIRTSQRSLVQLRMIDKAFIALRSNSEFKIEEYNLGAKKEEDVGIFSLIRGGFRAVTGIIGKRLRSSYKMRTVNATIGIRGTDYTARICNKDCDQAFGNLNRNGNIADGLYVGVNDGGVNLTNQLGTLDLDELQFGFVKDATSAPVALLSAPEFLYFNSQPPSLDEDNQASTEESEAVQPTIAARESVEPLNPDLNTDETIKTELKAEPVEVTQEDIEQNNYIEPTGKTIGGEEIIFTNGDITSSRQVVTSYGNNAAAGSISSVHSNPFSAATINNNDLQSFENNFISNSAGVGKYSQGSSSSVDLGFDPQTGIAWGRWQAGSAQLQSASGAATNIDLTNNSLHWAYSPDQIQNVALPSTGSSTYSLVGNTSPTDNRGNVGILGNATLNANFTAGTVDSSVAIGINNQVWNGSGSNWNINNNGGFEGDFDTVNVNTGTGNISGTGNAAGFFTNNADGAGLGFNLEAATGDGPTSVSGAAIFQKD